MLNIKTEISKIDNLTELNALSTYIKECKAHLGRTTLSVGMKVWVVQKTKRTPGVITKMKLKKANVDMRGSSYSVGRPSNINVVTSNKIVTTRYLYVLTTNLKLLSERAALCGVTSCVNMNITATCNNLVHYPGDIYRAGVAHHIRILTRYVNRSKVRNLNVGWICNGRFTVDCGGYSVRACPTYGELITC